MPENVGPAPMRRTASPWPHVLVPPVLPVTGKIDVPSVGKLPGPQMPPRATVVCQPVGCPGFATGKPTTQPKYGSQSPSWPP
jgi:hypothetical protein